MPLIPMDAEELTRQRDSVYGNAWELTDEFIRRHMSQLIEAPSPYAIIMMHNKLMRMLYSPRERDHYVDVGGYAQLALRSLDAAQGGTRHWLHEKD